MKRIIVSIFTMLLLFSITGYSQDMGTIRRTVDLLNRSEYQTGVKWRSVFFDDFFSLDTTITAGKDTLIRKWFVTRDDTFKGIFNISDTSHGVAKFTSSVLDISGTAGVNMRSNFPIVFLEKGHPVKFEAVVKVDSSKQTAWTIGITGLNTKVDSMGDAGFTGKVGLYFYKPDNDSIIYTVLFRDSLLPTARHASALTNPTYSGGESTATRIHVPGRNGATLDTAFSTRGVRLFSDFNRFTIIYDGAHTLTYQINGGYVWSDTSTAKIPYGKPLFPLLDFRSGKASTIFRWWIDYVEISDRRILAEDPRWGSGEVYQTTP